MVVFSPFAWFKFVRFFLLEMKTYLYNCIQLPVATVLRSTWATTRVASPGSPSQQSPPSQPKPEASTNTWAAIPFIHAEKLLVRCHRCLPVLPAPGRSAIMLGLTGLLRHFTPLPLSLQKHPLPTGGVPTAHIPAGSANVALHHGLLDSCLSTGDIQRDPSVRDPATG